MGTFGRYGSYRCTAEGEPGPTAGLFSILSTASTEKYTQWILTNTYWQLQSEKCGCSQSRDPVRSSPCDMMLIHSVRNYFICCNSQQRQQEERKLLCHRLGPGNFDPPPPKELLCKSNILNMQYFLAKITSN